MKNIPINLNGFELPIFIEKDSQYLLELNKVFDRYVEHLKTHIPEEAICISNVESNINSIKQAIENYFDAKPHKAYDNICSVLKEYTESPFIVSPLDENYAFRGIAPHKLTPNIYRNNSENQKGYEKMRQKELSFYKARACEKKLKREEMLHIPFNMRGRVATQRFSMPGIPCIYLGTTTFVTWLELGMPEKELFQVASYKLSGQLQILNLCISQMVINGSSRYIDSPEEEKNAKDFIEFFPLVIATSFKIMETNRIFKSEYIVSQLIMQVASELNIDGIAYLSKRFSDFYSYPYGVNLAIAVPYGNGEYWNKKDEVNITEVIRFSEFIKLSEQIKTRSFVNEIYADKDTSCNEVKIMGNVIKYSKLKFYDFDNYLVGQKYYKL